MQVLRRCVIFDAGLLGAAPLLALALRNDISIEPDATATLLPYMVLTLAVALPIYVSFGLSRTLWRYASASDYLRIAVAVSLIVTAATLATFLFDRMNGVARSIPVLQALISTCGMVLGRFSLGFFGARPRSPQTLKSMEPADLPDGETLLIIGVNRLTPLLLEAVADFRGGKARVGGIVALDAVGDGRKLNGFDVFESRDLDATLRTLSVHGVDVNWIMVAVSRERLPERMGETLRKIAKTARVRVEYLNETLGLESSASTMRRAPIAPYPDLQELALDPKQIELRSIANYRAAKRALDFALSALLLILLAPVWLGLAVLIKLTLGSPVYFWQLRPGRYGRDFKLVKFRTLSSAYDVNGRPVDMADRLGRVGRFLRKTRLDELPQIWNILIGEMSFIGPRPLLPVDQTAGASRRHLVRPGLTGYAQVIGGRDIPPADKMALDIWYVMNASLALDIEIVMRTVPFLLLGEHVDHEAIRTAWSDLRSGGARARRPTGTRYLSWIWT